MTNLKTGYNFLMFQKFYYIRSDVKVAFDTTINEQKIDKNPLLRQYWRQVLTALDVWKSLNNQFLSLVEILTGNPQSGIVSKHRIQIHELLNYWISKSRNFKSRHWALSTSHFLKNFIFKRVWDVGTHPIKNLPTKPLGPGSRSRATLMGGCI